MSRYITLADLRDRMGFVGTQAQDQDGLMQMCIDDAEDYINAHTRRNFAGTAGTYYANRYEQDKVRNQALYLDNDLYSLTALQNGDTTTIPVGSVWLEPRNEGPPYRILRLKSQYVWVWNTDSDVVISGTWGYSTTPPPAIKEATVQLAQYYYRLKDTGAGDVTGFSEAGEVTYPKGIPDTVKYIIEKFKSRSGGVV